MREKPKRIKEPKEHTKKRSWNFAQVMKSQPNGYLLEKPYMVMNTRSMIPSLHTFNHNVVKGVPSLVLDSQLNRINFGICIHNSLESPPYHLTNWK
jgi:hypothetical protein